MMPFIASLGPWNWIILGAILLALELAAPGAFMMWLGLSAILVGVLSFVWGDLVMAMAGHRLRGVRGRLDPALAALRAQGRAAGASSPFLNRRTEAMVGRVFTLDKPIVDGVGTIRIDDTVWRVSGPDCPAGSRVRIARVDGANLVVEPAE